jgi:hypothetical protein
VKAEELPTTPRSKGGAVLPAVHCCICLNKYGSKMRAKWRIHGGYLTCDAHVTLDHASVLKILNPKRRASVS